MSIIETVLVFVGIPAVVIAVIYGLVYGGGGAKRARRYRPGRPFEFTPVWFLSAPELLSGDGRDGNAPAISGANRLALSKAGAEAGGALTKGGPGGGEQGDGGSAEVATHDATGGASDRW